MLILSLANIDSEKMRMSDGATESLSQAEQSLTNLSNSAKYWIELSKTLDHVHSIVVDSGFVSTRSADDEVQDSQPSNRQQY